MLCQETNDQRAQVHVTVCVCTFRRPQLLQRGLMALQRMDTKGEFTFSIVVADNDSNQSARTVVEECAKTATIDIAYCVETQQNIALARNQAIRRGRGEFVAFIDDDEWPSEQWLSLMLKTCETCHADGCRTGSTAFRPSSPNMGRVRAFLGASTLRHRPRREMGGQQNGQRVVSIVDC